MGFGNVADVDCPWAVVVVLVVRAEELVNESVGGEGRE